MSSTGPCEAWTSIDEVRACGCPEPPDGPSDMAVLAAIDFASEVLYGLTNRLFPGVCVDVVRPCARTVGGAPAAGPWGLPAGWSSGGWSQWWRWDRTWGYCSCNRGRECGCCTLSEIALPGYPVQEILEVLVDGVALVEGVNFRVDDDWFLARIDGEVWPCCQNLALPATEVGTWQVRYEFGVEPSLGASRAAADYACQIARRCAGLPCQLPERVSTITRQGVTAAFLDPQDYIALGLTGLPLVDTWISSITLGKRRRGPARIASVDVGRRVRRTRDAGGS